MWYDVRTYAKNKSFSRCCPCSVCSLRESCFVWWVRVTGTKCNGANMIIMYLKRGVFVDQNDRMDDMCALCWVLRECVYVWPTNDWIFLSENTETINTTHTCIYASWVSFETHRTNDFFSSSIAMHSILCCSFSLVVVFDSFFIRWFHSVVSLSPSLCTAIAFQQFTMQCIPFISIECVSVWTIFCVCIFVSVFLHLKFSSILVAPTRPSYTHTHMRH